MKGTRSAIAALGITVLVAITVLCPSWVCAPTVAAHACCHRAQHTKPPCDTTSETCPYLLLEKTKAIVVHFDLPALQIFTIAPDRNREEPVQSATSFVPDAAGLYLRNRVLLI